MLIIILNNFIIDKNEIQTNNKHSINNPGPQRRAILYRNITTSQKLQIDKISCKRYNSFKISQEIIAKTRDCEHAYIIKVIIH